MASLFSDAQIADLHEGRTTANRTFADLRERYLVKVCGIKGSIEDRS
jgi:hypothetical protein